MSLGKSKTRERLSPLLGRSIQHLLRMLHLLQQDIRALIALDSHLIAKAQEMAAEVDGTVRYVNQTLEGSGLPVSSEHFAHMETSLRAFLQKLREYQRDVDRLREELEMDGGED